MRYSLRTLICASILGGAVLCMALSYVVDRRSRVAALSRIRSTGGTVIEDGGAAGVAGARVSLLNSVLREEDVRAISRLGNVRSLRVDGCRWDATTLDRLSPLTHLKAFSAVHTCLTDGSLQFLVPSRNLHIAILSDTCVSCHGIADSLHLDVLERLELARTQVDDRSAQELSGAKRLLILNLDETQISDSGLAYLENLSTLALLCVRGTRVTRSGVDSFRAAVPHAVIAWDGAPEG